jgi:hypothetical protein
MTTFAAIIVLSAAVSAPPPVKSLPGSTYVHIPAAQAIQDARKKGPGTCEDLAHIQAIPARNQYGWDPYVDRIMVHFPRYRDCLIAATADPTPARVIGIPGLLPRTRGDLAHVLLVYGGVLSWNSCFPPEVLKTMGTSYEHSVYAWLAKPANRTAWHACVVRETASDASSQPVPLHDPD